MEILMGSIMMRVEELKEDHVIIEWFDTLNASPNTQRLNLLSMKFFTDWIGKTPEVLLTEAEDEIKSGILPRQRSIKKYFIGFRKSLQDKELAPLTVKTYMNGIKSFYRTFDIEIPQLPKTGTKLVALEENKAIPNKEDLQEALKVCDPLERAILLVGVSSGLSANEIINLKIKHFREGYDPKSEITTLNMRRIKENVDFVTFLSPEASRAVQEYLDYRKRTIKTGEISRLERLEKQNIFSDNDFLFIGRHISGSFLKNKTESDRGLGQAALMKIYRHISEKARKNTGKGSWNLIRSHNVRKYFNSTLLNAGADSFFTEYCMGHTLDDTRGAYFRASPEKLREIYAKYIPYLTIQKERDISESPEFQKIKDENQVLVTETIRHSIERKELQDLRERLELERADRVEYENNVESMVDMLVAERMAEFREQMMEGFNESMEQLKKNMKEKPIN